MPFCGIELGRRVERAECALVAAGTAAVAERVGADGAFGRAIAGGLAAFSGVTSPLTKVVGLGFGGVPAPAELEWIEGEFAARGACVQVELCSLADPALGEALTGRGYRLVGFEDVLGRELDPGEAPREHEGIAIAPCSAPELETWIDVVTTAFARPDGQGVASHESFPSEALALAMRDMTRMPGLTPYLARRQGVPAGGASLHVAGGIAQLCGAATLPEHRRRGVQGALLARRLREAALAGCDLAVVTTLPGSKSAENAQRSGFLPLYTRAILRLAGAGRPAMTG